MRRRHLAAVQDSDPIRPGDLLEGFSSVATFAPGHPLRRMRCLACAALLGGRPIRIYTCIVFSAENCTCGSVPTISYPICADHGTDAGHALPQLALDRWQRHHETEAGCGDQS